MTDIFEEVEEDIRRERLVKLIRRVWPYALGGVLLLLAGIWGAQAYMAAQAQARRDFSDQFIAAQELISNGEWDQAESRVVELLKQAPAAYRAPLHMERAAAFIGRKEYPKALEALDAAIASSKSPALSDMARLVALYIASEIENPATFDARLEPLLDHPGQFGLLAREVAATRAYQAGDLQAAREHLDIIEFRALDMSPAFSERVRNLALLVGVAKADAPASGADAAAPAAAENSE